MLSFKEAENIALKENYISEEYFDKLLEYSKYGSMGTLNTVIRILSILRERICEGQKIKYEKTDCLFSSESFRTIVSDKFGEYIETGVFQKSEL